ncbi:flagellin N-terminal helical domain-containing protein [Bacillus cereus group sp. BY6-1LC]|uniref:flagellin N-terminal helical domain-containing protein n=1 Tax=Bacillus cereus group sp. BY6-1LC TaxID=3018077 RepID=UPI0022E7C349|nr:flagellin [Bacillus cereus group sp. BY6-1LC]MDA1801670.1 flagellin [Bacillus cereus group sp. BY6-1LC]
MRINTNINSMRTQEYMRQNQAKMSNAMDRLSSGKRINNASDDAAGLAIATRMRARENGLGVAANNTQDGMSLIRTADSALNSVSNILLRMRDIANQSANGTNTTENQQALDKEFSALKDQIDYIAKNTEFNDKKLLNGDNTSIDIQTLDSSDQGKQIQINLSNVSTKSLKIDQLSISGGKTVTIDKNALDAATDAAGTLETLDADSTDQEIEKAVNDFKAAYNEIKKFNTPEQQAAVNTAIENFNKNRSLDTAAKIKEAFTEPGEDATATLNASTAISSIDDALESIASNRATLGATLNRLDFNVNNLKSQESAMAASKSQIEDADMAKEMSEMTKFKILNEAGISMLSQANQTPQMVSKLLQ